MEPPTIAAIRGGAVGAGLNLALATDLRVVAEDARLSSGFMPIGIHPGRGHSALLARATGREVANAIQLFGQAITGVRAVELGLAWTATPADAVVPTALDLAEGAGRRPRARSSIGPVDAHCRRAARAPVGGGPGTGASLPDVVAATPRSHERQIGTATDSETM